MGSGRDAALEALTACRRLDAWSDGSMKAACRGLDRREAALCARLAYGVLQNRALLDFYLGSYCAFAKLEPFIRDVLRLGAYQILYMDRVPDSAAVNEAVETVKRKKRQRSAGLVRLCRRGTGRTIWPCATATPAGWWSGCWTCWAGRRRRPFSAWTTRASPRPSSATPSGVRPRS